ncbi:CAP domain-containing protein [Candidatus Chloroploca sp. M-50]|uniref:CAP domain-containing protein n=1 Tax=Candidatus Chloroploca mongolica TaxID=2528176 RepID=A0ABS4DB54_9CHLR|nr:CAP domain-containing protein [Candidatus Chloroploca mongolica]MBP1466659.1 CAP domain-containing protein [Candidatus Chloroploca mongolica]
MKTRSNQPVYQRIAVRLLLLFLLILPVVQAGAGGPEHGLYATSSVQAPLAEVVTTTDATSTRAMIVYLPFVARSEPEPIVIPPEQQLFVSEVLAATNAYRAQAGCAPLTLSPLLSTSAQRHTDDMAYNNFVSHTGSDGSSPWDRIRATGYTYSRAAENVAAGHTCPQQVVEAWYSSDGHRANMLNCALTEIGIGYTHNEPSLYKYYWTQDFATPR